MTTTDESIDPDTVYTPMQKPQHDYENVDSVSDATYTGLQKPHHYVNVENIRCCS